MSTVQTNHQTGGVGVSEGISPRSSNSRPLHRIRDVRQQQCVSLRSAARKLNRSVPEIRLQEDARSDLRISELLQWQHLLDVPLSDLLVDSDGPLSAPVCKRASLLRVMKTAKAIQESAHDVSVKRLARMMTEQLIEIMPELAGVSAWHTVGQRRTQDEVGRIAERTVPDNFFNDVPH